MNVAAVLESIPVAACSRSQTGQHHKVVEESRHPHKPVVDIINDVFNMSKNMSNMSKNDNE